MWRPTRGSEGMLPQENLENYSLVSGGSETDIVINY